MTIKSVLCVATTALTVSLFVLQAFGQDAGIETAPTAPVARLYPIETTNPNDCVVDVINRSGYAAEYSGPEIPVVPRGGGASISAGCFLIFKDSAGVTPRRLSSGRRFRLGAAETVLGAVERRTVCDYRYDGEAGVYGTHYVQRVRFPVIDDPNIDYLECRVPGPTPSEGTSCNDRWRCLAIRDLQASGLTFGSVGEGSVSGLPPAKKGRSSSSRSVRSAE